MNGGRLARMVFGAAGNLPFEALDIVGGIQAQVTGIGTHKTDGVSLARQILQPIVLQGFQMVLADLERAGDLGDFITTPEPGGTKVAAHGFQGTFAVARNFAQMDAAAVLAATVSAVILHRHLRNFGHNHTFRSPCPISPGTAQYL